MIRPTAAPPRCPAPEEADDKITVRGWVKDTAKNGQCAQMYGNAGTRNFESKKACPAGKTEDFSFTGKAKSAKIYIRGNRLIS